MAAINIPKKIRVGGVDYTVKFTKQPIMVEGEECDGATMFDDCEIVLRDSMSDQLIEITFLHELLHTVFDDACLHDICFNEDAVERAARSLYKVLKDNPKLFGGD